MSECVRAKQIAKGGGQAKYGVQDPEIVDYGLVGTCTFDQPQHW